MKLGVMMKKTSDVPKIIDYDYCGDKVVNDLVYRHIERAIESNKKYKASNNKLMEAVKHLKQKLEEVNLANAKLFYTNRVLRSSSLNERQKNKIVEALSDVGSVNEAKVLYETLQNAVGPSRKEGPQSLSEAVSRPSSMLPRRKSQDNDPNPFSDRMKILAGIKNN